MFKLTPSLIAHLKKLFKAGIEKINLEDLTKILKDPKKVFDLADKLGKLASKVKLLWAMLKDWKNGNYKEVSWEVIAAIVFVLAYLISPIDVIPDPVPFAGLVDDAFVIGLLLKKFSDQIDAYKKWKEQSDGNAIILD